ncbi:hypothetical protein WJX77_002863 [Trebouxia sp. C0004]
MTCICKPAEHSILEMYNCSPDGQGKFYCWRHLFNKIAEHLHSQYSSDALIIWALKQQECPPDIVRNIYQLVIGSLNLTQLEATAKALHHRHQRQQEAVAAA